MRLSKTQKEKIRDIFSVAISENYQDCPLFNGIDSFDYQINEIANCYACNFVDSNNPNWKTEHHDYYYAIIAYCNYLKKTTKGCEFL